MEREALKLALEVLKSDYTFVWPAMHRPEKTEKKRDDAIIAIKAALAQPAQDPVGEIRASSYGHYPVVAWVNGYVAKIGDKFYTTPPQREWVGLTDEQKETNNG